MIAVTEVQKCHLETYGRALGALCSREIDDLSTWTPDVFPSTVVKEATAARDSMAQLTPNGILPATLPVSSRYEKGRCVGGGGVGLHYPTPTRTRTNVSRRRSIAAGTHQTVFNTTQKLLRDSWQCTFVPGRR